MSHLLTSVEGVKPNSQGAITQLSTASYLQDVNQGDVLAVTSTGESVTRPLSALRAFAHGGANTTTSSVSLFVPLSNSIYPYFLEIAPLKINNIPRLSVSTEAGFTWQYNAYGTRNTLYVNSLLITEAGVYDLSLDWCAGSLSASGAYIDVQWQTAGGTALGPIARLGRSDEHRRPCTGRVSVASSEVVGLYVHAVNGAKYNLDNFQNILITVERA